MSPRRYWGRCVSSKSAQNVRHSSRWRRTGCRADLCCGSSCRIFARSPCFGCWRIAWTGFCGSFWKRVCTAYLLGLHRHVGSKRAQKIDSSSHFECQLYGYKVEGSFRRVIQRITWSGGTRIYSRPPKPSPAYSIDRSRCGETTYGLWLSCSHHVVACFRNGDG